MKPKVSYQPCEYCDAKLSIESPPPNSDYVKGRIYIKEGSILLDAPENTAIHASGISGYYCSIDCLIAELRKARWKA